MVENDHARMIELLADILEELRSMHELARDQARDQRDWVKDVISEVKDCRVRLDDIHTMLGGYG